MLIDEREIIEKYKLKKDIRVLDIGGSMEQRKHIRVDTLVDIIAPEDAPYTPSKLKARNFVKLDITKEKLPFGNREFDFCLCTHTLEDLTDPFLVISEMQRVAKKGLIITPCWGADMVFSHVDATDWLTGIRRLPGQAHHKWFFEKVGRNTLRVVSKVYPVLYTSKFHVTEWRGEPEMIFYWHGGFEVEEVDTLNIHSLIDVYEKYLAKNKKKFTRGRVLVYLDEPLYYFKAALKYLLKRGVGYTKRSL